MSPNGLRKEGSGASRRSPRNKRDADVRAYQHSMTSKLQHCWESQSKQAQRHPLRRLLQPRRKPSSRLDRSARMSRNGLPKEGSGVSRPSRQSRRGEVAKVCPHSTTRRWLLCSANQRQPLRQHTFRRRHQLLPRLGLQQLQLRQLHLYPAAEPRVRTSVLPQLEHRRRRQRVESHRSARKTAKLISSAGDWCGAQSLVFWSRGSLPFSVSFCRVLCSSLQPASRSVIPRSMGWAWTPSSNRDTASG